MTFGWGVLIGVLATISVEAVLVVTVGLIVNARKAKMFNGLKRDA